MKSVKFANLILFSALAVFLGLYFSGCKKFLTVPPDLRTEIKSVKTVKQLLGSAYPDFTYQPFTEFASDNQDYKQGFATSTSNTRGSILTFPYLFKDAQAALGDKDVSQSYWASCYSAIAAANKALQYISTVKDQNELAQLQPYKGEALLARAYAHFMLVVLFAQPYEIGENNNQQGVPYVKEVEDVGIKRYHRETVGKVYEFIENDLSEGLPLIQDAAYDVPKYHFNRAAAYTFATRFYLHKGDYAAVFSMANQALGGTEIKGYLRPWTTRYASYSYNEIRTNYARAAEKSNFLIIAARSTYQRMFASQAYGFSPKRVSYRSTLYSNLFGASQFDVTPPIYGNNQFSNIPKLSEYFKLSSPGAKTGYPYLIFPALTAEELLFNLAEAKLRLHDSAGCIRLLNDFAEARIKNFNRNSGGGKAITMDKAFNFYSGSSSKVKRADAPNDYAALEEPENSKLVGGLNEREKCMLKALLELKQYEFYYEGIRWFDIVRLHLTVKHTLDASGKVLEVKHGDKRRVFQVPNTVTTAGLELSPR